ncbi:MAG: hypothetical protein H0T76_05090 [Nannocystis sp.]|nr:hypothetical protein [Nannocystis sp.]MBA3545840.1 hypothetical protein [Nannocystis sp.]
MTNRSVILATMTGLLLLAGCANKTGGEPAGTPPGEPAPAPAGDTGRPSLTSTECEAKGGSVVGDIGDGAIHRPDYTCEGGQPPLGTIRAEGDGPIAIEGSVCCPAAS